jgi:guanylate kinase
MRRNNLSIVISAPSGAGKTTIINELLAQYGELEFSISSTTRPMRNGEIDGKNYFFISEEEFIARRDNDEFFEWAEVHGNFFGTQKKEIDRIRALGKIPIFDVDVQGSRSMKGQVHDAIFIFIIPPSLKILEERLKNRNTDSPEQIALRLKNAVSEMRQYPLFDYIIINDDLPGAGIEF